MEELDWKALARLVSTPDGQRLLDLLKRRREDCRDQLERVPDPMQIHRLQGCADTIKTLIGDLETAREVVAKRYS